MNRLLASHQYECDRQTDWRRRKALTLLYAVLLSVKIIEGTENAALMYFVRYDMMSYFNVC